MTTLTLFRLAFIALVSVLSMAVIRHGLRMIFAQRRQESDVCEQAAREMVRPFDDDYADLYEMVLEELECHAVELLEGWQKPLDG